MKDLKICSEIRHRGFYSPVKILTKKQCKDFLESAGKVKEPFGWWKGYAIISSLFYNIATNQKIVEIVSSVIGHDVLLWGSCIVTREPGNIHPWHCDLETSKSPPGKSISVWIGLCNSRKSSLKMISYSHKFSKILQQTSWHNNTKRGKAKDSDVLGWAREENCSSELITTYMKDGEAIFFDGKLWHCSYNRNIFMDRKAILLQYVSTDVEVRKINLSQLDWPFDNSTEPKVPCILINGYDNNGVNSVLKPRF